MSNPSTRATEAQPDRPNLQNEQIFEVADQWFQWDANSWQKAKKGTIGMPALLGYTKAAILADRAAQPVPVITGRQDKSWACTWSRSELVNFIHERFGNPTATCLSGKDLLNIKLAMVHLQEAKFHAASDNLRAILARFSGKSGVSSPVAARELDADAERREFERVRAELLKLKPYPSDFDLWLAARSAAQGTEENIEAICDAYESGVGHGLKGDGHSSGAAFANPACGKAYEIGYTEGVERQGTQAGSAPPDLAEAADRLLRAAKVYSFNYMQDEADDEDDCVCGPKQHAEAKEVFAAIAELEHAKARAPSNNSPVGAKEQDNA